MQHHPTSYSQMTIRCLFSSVLPFYFSLQIDMAAFGRGVIVSMNAVRVWLQARRNLECVRLGIRGAGPNRDADMLDVAPHKQARE